MGTNYYWFEKSPCEKCGRPFESIHIGKSSAGWCFSLHVIPEEGINDLEDWQKRWAQPDSYIQDEYGDKVTPKEMTECITKRSGFKSNWGEAEYRANYAEPGSNNLARHIVDGHHCIKHGAGTWDCIIGEFS